MKTINIEELSAQDIQDKKKLLSHMETYELGSMIKNKIYMRSFGKGVGSQVFGIFNTQWILRFDQESFDRSIIEYVNNRPELLSEITGEVLVNG